MLLGRCASSPSCRQHQRVVVSRRAAAVCHSNEQTQGPRATGLVMCNAAAADCEAACGEAAVPSGDAEAPLFRVGVVTDVQYADIDDGASYMGTPRFYRHALEALQRAVSSWQATEKLGVVLHLGDILDGLQANAGRDASEAALSRVLDAFSVLEDAGISVKHCIGNHCLINLPRERLHSRLGITVAEHGGGAACYTFAPHAGFRVVVLDSYDLSVIGWPDGHERQVLASSILAAKNSNSNKNSPEGLEGLDRRFVAFGGGLSTHQLSWLDDTLQAADAARERVFVAIHTPVCPDSAPAVCLSWHYDEVLTICGRHPSCVATLAGHAHGGGYACDAAGIHHFVFPAVLECPPGENAFGHIDIWEDSFCIAGSGRLATTPVLKYRPWADAGSTQADALADELKARVRL